MRPHLFLLPLSLGLLQCTAPIDINLTLPEGTERSALIIIRPDDGPIVIAAALPLGGPLRLGDLSADAGFVPVDVLLYDVELNTLGFAPGEVSQLAAQDGGRPPATPARVFRSTRAGEPLLEDSFGSVTALPDLARSANPCSRFTAVRTPVVQHQWRPEVVRATASSALLVIKDGTMFLIDREDIVPVSVTSTLSPNAVFQAEDGTFWFGGHRGQIWSARLVGTELRDVEFHGAPRPDSIRLIDGGMRNGEMELYYLDMAGAWTRKHGDVIETLLVQSRNDDGGVVWLGPGHALMAHDLSTDVHEHIDGEVRAVTPQGNIRAITGLSKVPGIGAVALGAEGNVYRRMADGSFADSGNSGVPVYNFLAAPFEDRILIGASAGAIVEWVIGFGFCEPQTLASNGVRSIIDIGDGQAIVGADITDFSDEVVYVRIQRL